MNISLTFTPRQFQVIYEFLFNTKLGERNPYEKEIADLMIALDDQNIQDVVETYEKISMSAPNIRVQVDQDGMTFEVVEVPLY